MKSKPVKVGQLRKMSHWLGHQGDEDIIYVVVSRDGARWWVAFTRTSKRLRYAAWSAAMVEMDELLCDSRGVE